MANEKHLLLNIRGGYTAAGLTAEKWQCGVRLALFAGPSGNSAPQVGTLPNNWQPSPVNISRAETNWRIDGNWDIDLGAGAHFAPDDYLNDQVAPAVNNWFRNTIHYSGARVESLQLYPIGPDGTVLPAPPYSQGTPCTLTWSANNPVGTASGGGLPLQIAVVASHRTPQTGRRGRGRMFLPAIASSFVSANGTIASTEAQEAATRQATLLESLTYFNLTTEFFVRPIITGSPWTQYAFITQTQCGTVPDTQRRRRNALVETFYSEPVTP